ncbi:MAG: hypothetical protein NC413_12205 [Muribaculum sp.]|nr:hypothetical protein [Muribaculum sp.]
MGLMDIFSKKKQKAAAQTQPKSENTLAEDIVSSAEWVVQALNSSGYHADYTLESMKEIDRFFDEQSGPNGIISQNRGQILFAVASYVGQTIIKLYGGTWVTDDDDPQGEINIAVTTSDNVTVWPVMRCMKRLTNGSEDGIYAYVYALDRKNRDA